MQDTRHATARKACHAEEINTKHWKNLRSMLARTSRAMMSGRLSSACRAPAGLRAGESGRRDWGIPTSGTDSGTRRIGAPIPHNHGGERPPAVTEATRAKTLSRKHPWKAARFQHQMGRARASPRGRHKTSEENRAKQSGKTRAPEKRKNTQESGYPGQRNVKKKKKYGTGGYVEAPKQRAWAAHRTR